MLYSLLEHYFEQDNLPWYSPLAVDVETAGDYHLYLYEAGEADWFVVVEADYLTLKDVPQDIETSFPVEVEGWYALLEYQKQTGQKILPRNAFKDEDINESGEAWQRYHGVVYDERMKYALLQVKPRQDTRAKDFNLTYYDN